MSLFGMMVSGFRNPGTGSDWTAAASSGPRNERTARNFGSEHFRWNRGSSWREHTSRVVGRTSVSGSSSVLLSAVTLGVFGLGTSMTVAPLTSLYLCDPVHQDVHFTTLEQVGLGHL